MDIALSYLLLIVYSSLEEGYSVSLVVWHRERNIEFRDLWVVIMSAKVDDEEHEWELGPHPKEVRDGCTS